MMLWTQLHKRAYTLAMRLNHHLIINDIPMMTESELMGVIGFLIRLQES
jgi:DMSO/TMAO reductase YedYZ heme-binding membrane subunit